MVRVMGSGAFTWRMCEGKTRYTEDEANAEAERHGHGMKTYACPVCDGWHIGHKRRSGRKLRAGVL